MRLFLRARRWYWVCQLVGWSGFAALQTLNFLLVTKDFSADVAQGIAASVGMGLVLTHAYRTLLLRYQVLRAPVAVVAGVAALGVAGLSGLLAGLYLSLAALDQGSWAGIGWQNVAFSALSYSQYMAVWVLAYHGFALGERLARVQVRQLQAEAARRQAELDLLRSQINPHFLFNALNSE